MATDENTKQNTAFALNCANKNIIICEYSLLLRNSIFEWKRLGYVKRTKHWYCEGSMIQNTNKRIDVIW